MLDRANLRHDNFVHTNAQERNKNGYKSILLWNIGIKTCGTPMNTHLQPIYLINHRMA